MKNIKKRILTLTVSVCLLPIIIGAVLWNLLPESIPIHFDFYGNPDNFAPKWAVVIVFPILLAIVQSVCCVSNDIALAKRGGSEKFSLVAKLIIPFMTVFIEGATFAYALGVGVDFRIVAGFIVGTVLVSIGSVIPSLDYVKNYNLSRDEARKINRCMGLGSVIVGILILISLFFPPIVTLVCILSVIPLALLGAVYTAYISGKK